MNDFSQLSKRRGISEAKLQDLVEKQTSKPIIGMPTVNILAVMLKHISLTISINRQAMNGQHFYIIIIGTMRLILIWHI